MPPQGLGTTCPFPRVPPYYLYTAWLHPELPICGLADLALLCVQAAWLILQNLGAAGGQGSYPSQARFPSLLPITGQAGNQGRIASQAS